MTGEMEEEGKEEERTKHGAKKRHKQRGMQRRRRRRNKRDRKNKEEEQRNGWDQCGLGVTLLPARGPASPPATQVLTPKGDDSTSKDQSQGILLCKDKCTNL